MSENGIPKLLYEYKPNSSRGQDLPTIRKEGKVNG
jgi:hypothetical protein